MEFESFSKQHCVTKYRSDCSNFRGARETSWNVSGRDENLVARLPVTLTTFKLQGYFQRRVTWPSSGCQRCVGESLVGSMQFEGPEADEEPLVAVGRDVGVVLGAVQRDLEVALVPLLLGADLEQPGVDEDVGGVKLSRRPSLVGIRQVAGVLWLAREDDRASVDYYQVQGPSVFHVDEQVQARRDGQALPWRWSEGSSPSFGS